MLKPVLTKVSNSKDSRELVVKDSTGAYNVITNPGGYGVPNQVSPPTLVGFKIRYWSEAASYVNFATQDATLINNLLTTGTKLDASVLGFNAFQSGVHQLKYYVFSTVSSIITLTQGSRSVIVTSGTAPTAYDPAYVAAVILDAGGILKSNVKLISNKTAGGFDLDTAWTGASVAGYTLMLATESDLKVLFTGLANECVANRIGELAVSGVECNTDTEALLSRLVLWIMAAKQKFNCKNYQGAHEMLQATLNQCNNCIDINCKNCS